MKKKQFRKRILSTVLAWMLIAANVFPSIAVQAADVTDVVVEQELAVEELFEEEAVAGEEEVTGEELVTEDGTEVEEIVVDEAIEVNDSAVNEELVTFEDSATNEGTEVTDAVTYEIYPTPHSMVYGEGEYEVGEVNLVYDSTIDQVTKNRMEAILASKDITFSVTSAVAEGKTNILIGTYKAAEKEYVQTQFEALQAVTEADFEGFTAHFVVSKDNNIYVLGEDVDAAFYGVTTLKHVFAQMEGNTIRNFNVKDYADVNIRGFIEGYYGVPWSNEDRMSLMEFGGEFKMTSYIFAPKDDLYHKDLWRDLYPEKEFEAIKEMVEVGNATKCRFVWTAHPFMGGFNANDVEGETAALLRKFDQLYDAGVRQFGVLGDDVGQLNRSVVIQLMTAVSNWAKEKGDVYDTVFCPAGYNHSWQGNYTELNEYEAGFPDDIQIFWTGEAVCQPIEVKTLDHFMKHNLPEGAEPRRAPLFWLNWPVNDINHSRMLMGKGSLLHTDVDPATLAGAVTNPMQEAEASKNALFAVADYSWNIANFNEDTSWVDGFKYIEPDATEELFILANHMSDPSPNGHGLDLEESANIKDMLSTYLASGTGGEEIKAEFAKIAAACDEFHVKSKNENLKDELLPFTNSLKDLVNAGIAFIDTQNAINAGDENAVWSSYSQASAYLGKSKTYAKPTLSGVEIVDPGSKRIMPFVEGLNSTLAPIVLSMVDDTKQFINFHTNRTDLSASVLDVILDNDEGTEVISKNPTSIAIGDYVGITFTKAIDLENVIFKMGQSGNARDTFTSAKVQYTEDGAEWIDIEGTEYTDNRATVTVENLDLEVKGIRLIATDVRGNTWLGIKDILINGRGLLEVEEDGVEPYTGTVIKTEEYNVYQTYVESNMFDGNDETFVWYENSCETGHFVGVDFGEAKQIGSIHFAMPSGDCMANYTLQYSLDNSTWTDIGTYTDLVTDVECNEQPITARYIRAKSNSSTGKWLKIAEFTAKEPVVEIIPVYTNKKEEDVSDLVATVETDHATLVGTVTLGSGEYVGVDLGRIKDITSITATYTGNVVVQSSKNEVVWNEHDLSDASRTYEDARFVRIINNTEHEVTLALTSLEVRSYEVYPISVFDTNYGNADTHLLAFDQDRTTEAVLQASQYVGKFITYDLGQVIDLNSLKLVLHDGTTDYPRHAKVSVSKDNQTWKEIMLIGNQTSDNTGEATNEDDISQLFPVHETSYYTRSVENLNQEVRYIKFEITRNKSGADKWVRIREIELNGGNIYLPEANDPTIESDLTETSDNKVSNMIDGDVSTIYTPIENADGEFTYHIPGDTAISMITILQNPAMISNAEVTAKVVENGVEREVVLGNLAGSLNRFEVVEWTCVNSITVKWTKDNLPGIYEIILKKNEEAPKVEEIIKELTDFTITGDISKFYDGTPVTTEGIVVEGLEDTSNVIYKFYDNSQGIVPLAAEPADRGVYWVRAVVETDGAVTAKSNLLRFEIIGEYNTVTFDSDGGNKIVAQKVLTGGVVKEPKEPVKKGYVFLGWYSGSGKYNFETKVTRDFTLKAKWQEIVKYTVTFENEGRVVATSKVLKGETVKQPTDPKKEGYLFAGWFIGENKYNFAAKVMKDFTLTAKWTADTTALQDLIRANEGMQQSNYTKESWEAFEGAWNSAKEILKKEDITLQEVTDAKTALQAAITGLQVQLVPPTTNMVPGTVSANTTISLYAAVEGASVYYTLDGTQPTETSTLYATPIVLNEDTTIKAITVKEGYGTSETAEFKYAVVTEESKLYVVTYDSAGGSAISAQTVEENKAAKKPTNPVKEGYRFEGWYIGDIRYDFAAPVKEDIVLTAKWVVDASELKNLVDDYAGLSRGRYTETSWNNFVTAYNSAKEVLENEVATTEDVENAKTALIMAVEALEKGVPEGIWVDGLDNIVYTGAKQTPEITVYDGEKELIAGKDYTVSFKNNQNVYMYDEEDIGKFSASKAPKATLKMKGDYSGKKDVFFKIRPVSIVKENEEIVVSDLYVTYTGKKQTPAPEIYWNDKKLTKKDFYVKDYQEDSKDFIGSANGKGSVDLTIVGQGNFAGERIISYTIGAQNTQIAMDKVTVKSTKSMAWNTEDGMEAQITKIEYKYKGGKDTLEEYTDYTVSYEHNDAVGTAYLVLEGTEEDEDGDGISYHGIKRIPYKITGTSMSKVKTTKFGKFTYTGEPIELLDEGVDVYCGAEDNLLAPDEQFTVEYVKHIDKGTATMILTGMPEGGFTGVKKVNYKITAAELGNEDAPFVIELADGETEVAYTSGGCTPKVVVTSSNGIELEEGKDYTLSYKNNKAVTKKNDKKQPTVIVKGKGNYAKTQEENFTIVPKQVYGDSDVLTVVAKDKVVKMTGKNGWKQSFKIYDTNEKALTSKDFDKDATYRVVEAPAEYEYLLEKEKLTDKDQVPADSVIEVTIDLKGSNYEGYVIGTYRILNDAHDISKATFKITDQVYNGSAIFLSESDFETRSIKLNRTDKEPYTLRLGEEGDADADFIIVDYDKNTNKGTAKVTLRGVNDFGGEKTVSFKIKQRSIDDNWWEKLVTSTQSLFSF